jgi:tripartite-type tricarboxylate transporter receptor subunit TctC
MPLRRTLARWSLAALFVMTGFGGAAAQTYPDRPVRLVVGFPAGQATDIVARRIAQKMSEDLKQNVFVDNRPGAGGAISHQAVKTAVPDGYTLLMGSTATLAINPTLYRKLPYDPLKDFEPIATMTAGPLFLFAPPSTPVNNLQEMIAYVKAQPGKVSYGSPGNGTTAHIAMEMLKKAAGGIEMLHVPYKGAPAMITDVIGGQVQFAFDAAASVVPHAKAGRVKLLGVTSLQRSDALPDVPTLAEQGLAGFEAMTWAGMLAPKGTPAAIVDKLNGAVNKALKDPDVATSIGTTGSSVNSPW